MLADYNYGNLHVMVRVEFDNSSFVLRIFYNYKIYF